MQARTQADSHAVPSAAHVEDPGAAPSGSGVPADAGVHCWGGVGSLSFGTIAPGLRAWTGMWRAGAGAPTARAATEKMLFSLALRREGERVPELPLAPLLNDTPKRSLRGRCATRMAALGGANLRPASAGGAAWKISFGSSRPWRAAATVRRLCVGCASTSSQC